jgi:hypothetical protein
MYGRAARAAIRGHVEDDGEATGAGRRAAGGSKDYSPAPVTVSGF